MSLTLSPSSHSPALHANRVFEVVEHGRAAETSDLVARSWQRCLQDYHLHPDRPRKPQVLPKAQLDARCRGLVDLLDCARYEMTTLYQQLADAESAVVLTDIDGVILHMVSSPEFAEEVAPLGFHVGAVWSEAEAEVIDRWAHATVEHGAVIGGNAMLEAWLDAGHLLGNHTYGHVDAHVVGIAAFEDAILRGERQLRPMLARPLTRTPTNQKFPSANSCATRALYWPRWPISI